MPLHANWTKTRVAYRLVRTSTHLAPRFTSSLINKESTCLFQSAVLTLLSALMLVSCGPPTSSTAPKPDSDTGPSIEGTYKLISRATPDGKMITPPQIQGLFTYTKTHRNFNIVGEDAKGKFFGSIGATYKLTSNEYSQTQIFYFGNEDADRAKIVYEGTKEPQTVPLKTDGRRIEFKLPGDEPTLVSKVRG